MSATSPSMRGAIIIATRHVCKDVLDVIKNADDPNTDGMVMIEVDRAIPASQADELVAQIEDYIQRRKRV